MYSVIFAAFKIHDSEFIIIGAIAYAIMWSANRLIKYLREKRLQEKSIGEMPGTPCEKKKPGTILKYSIWLLNFVVWLILCFMIKYVFYWVNFR